MNPIVQLYKRIGKPQVVTDPEDPEAVVPLTTEPLKPKRRAGTSLLGPQISARAFLKRMRPAQAKQTKTPSSGVSTLLEDIQRYDKKGTPKRVRAAIVELVEGSGTVEELDEAIQQFKSVSKKLKALVAQLMEE